MIGSQLLWEKQKDVPYATDDDFSGIIDGSFKYIGTATTVRIPHTIKGIPVTSYAYMFEGTYVERVISDNPNVTTMSQMFYDSKATILNLSSFDTSNVLNMRYMFANTQMTILNLSSFDTSNVTDMINMGSMFAYSQITIGYARTQTDADKFNASSDKPAGLTFIVHPNLI